jgi:hypothetical protein
MLVLNQKLLSCSCNITQSMRSVTEYYKNCQTELTRSIYGTIALDSIESNMKLNELKQKRKVSNPAKNSHNSKFKTSQKELNVL